MTQKADLKFVLKESLPAAVVLLAFAFVGNIIEGIIDTIFGLLPESLGFIASIGRMVGMSIDTGLTYAGLIIALGYIYVRLANRQGPTSDDAEDAQTSDSAPVDEQQTDTEPVA